jgi:hypothetical protein
LLRGQIQRPQRLQAVQDESVSFVGCSLGLNFRSIAIGPGNNQVVRAATPTEFESETPRNFFRALWLKLTCSYNRVAKKMPDEKDLSISGG